VGFRAIYLVFPNHYLVELWGLSQDRDCLIAAKVWDNSHEPATKHTRLKMMLSTRFALQPNGNSEATNCAVLLKKNKYIQISNFLVYLPNAFAKDTCDPE
jgi:hypothetical protein